MFGESFDETTWGELQWDGPAVATMDGISAVTIQHPNIQTLTNIFLVPLYSGMVANLAAIHPTIISQGKILDILFVHAILSYIDRITGINSYIIFD